MATTIEVRDTSAYGSMVGPPGPTDYVVFTPSASAPRAVGDLWVEKTTLLAWDTDWTYPTLLNGWVNYGNDGTNYQVARYRQLPSSMVVIEGLIKSGTVGSGGPFFTLPVGYRPAGTSLFATCGNTMPSRVDVGSNGNVWCQTGTNTWLSICLAFYPDL